MRKHYFGANASAASFRDSFVLNEAIDRFPGKVEDLLSEEIASKDGGSRTAKSITYRSESFEKVNDLATLSDLTFAETTRRIILFMVDEIEKSERENPREYSEYERAVSALKTKILIVASALDNAMSALNSLVEEVETLEGKAE